MTRLLKDFLLNIFIIFSPFSRISIYRFQSGKYYRFILYILFSLAIVFTMSFPVNLSGGLTYDLRSIPLTVGSLYGGTLVSLLLYATLVGCRFMIGNPNRLFYAVSLLPTFLLFIFLLRMYAGLTLVQKIVCAVLVSSLIRFFTAAIYLFLIQDTVRLTYNVMDSINIYVLQGCIVGIYIYLIEFLQKYKLRQALINIGKNAIEAMTTDGLLEIRLQKRNHSVVVTVRDNGIGMTPEQVNRLGSPYFFTKDKGTGLGTMVSFHIVKKMDGKIDVAFMGAASRFPYATTARSARTRRAAP